MDKGSTNYNMPTALMMAGNLDRERLLSAIHKLIQRHESLRTGFIMKDGEPVQKIFAEVDCPIYDFEITPEQVEQVIKDFIRPFDLSHPPLLRVGLVKLADKRHLLLVDMHHIIMDGVSAGILTKELCQLYQGQTLSPVKIQYKDYAVWQQSQLTSVRLKAEERYWLKTLGGEVPVLDLPIDYPRSVDHSSEGSMISFNISKELTQKLRILVKEHGATMYMVLLAAYNTLLYRYSGQNDIIIGSPIAGRSRADLQMVLGMFVNTLAMRTKPDGKKSFHQLVTEVKANALLAYENQNYQFEDLVDKLGFQRNVSRNPLFDTVFSMENTDHKVIELFGLEVSPYQIENRTAKFDLTLEAIELDEQINFHLEYRTRLFKQTTIERFSKHFINILGAVAENPALLLDEIVFFDSRRERANLR